MNSHQHALGQFLRRLLRHSELSKKERAAILALPSHATQIQARFEIGSPGQVVDHACLVVKGLAGRIDQMKNGRRQMTALHIPGDMCDLHSIVQPKAGWSTTALNTTTVLHVPHTSLRELTRDYPNIAMAFWRDTTTDASILAKWLANFGRRDARARLAHLLCEMGLRMEAAQIGTRTAYHLSMTQDQLSDTTGMTAVHVNRTLQSLRATGILRYQQGLVEISDWAELVAIANYTDNYLFLDTESGDPAG